MLSLKARQELFYASAFGTARAMLRFKVPDGDAEAAAAAAAVTGKIPHAKLRIAREHVLASAHHIFGALAKGPFALDVEFADEAGTGLGPTMEFYALASQALRHPALALFRSDSYATTADGFSHHAQGLFFAPLAPGCAATQRIVQLCELLGRILARAILDYRLVRCVVLGGL